MKNLIILCTLVLAGCATATVKTPVPISGSKADATVNLAYDYGLFEKPVVDWKLANATAKQRCAAWGYKGAEAFGGSQAKCIKYSGSGSDCMAFQEITSYQCTGK